MKTFYFHRHGYTTLQDNTDKCVGLEPKVTCMRKEGHSFHHVTDAIAVLAAVRELLMVPTHARARFDKLLSECHCLKPRASISH